MRQLELGTYVLTNNMYISNVTDTNSINLTIHVGSESEAKVLCTVVMEQRDR